MKYRGQNLIEFLIVFATVAIASILAFTLLGGNIFALFGKINDFNPFNMNQQAQEITLTNSSVPANSTETGSTVTVGPLGGTANNPVLQCTKSKCDLDLGDYLLTGIPENFGELVQTTGTSGGTESLLALINQIANQLGLKGDIDGAKEFRDLANLCHFMAEMQKETESLAQTCSSDINPASCIKQAYDSNSSVIDLPTNLNTVLPGFTSTAHASLFNEISVNNYIGFAKNNFAAVGTVNKSSRASYAIVYKYQSIMNNTKYSDSIKGITQELYAQISDLSFNMMGKLRAIDKAATTGTPANVTGLYDYDPITGVSRGNPGFILEDGMNDITHPKTSLNTNIKSALICGAGWNKDTGSKCH